MCGGKGKCIENFIWKTLGEETTWNLALIGE
jgi:hypothetical protein